MKKISPPPIVFILTLLILASAVYWFFFLKPAEAPASNPVSTTPLPADTTAANKTPAFSLPAAVPNGMSVKISGSTSMVLINESLKMGFQRQFPGTKISTQAGGSDKGIQDLIIGNTDLAAVSRNLTSQEQGQGLVAVPVSTDVIAITVGNDNPFRTGLKSEQVAKIFQGQITEWSAVGGTQGQIHVINRPAISGTHQAFQENVLKGGNFGTTPNITTLPQDTTTSMLQSLKKDGIGYATFSQVGKQQTVRTVAIDGLTPEATNYPFTRSLYYVYKSPPSPTAQAFLGYATSPPGKAMVSSETTSN
jgi:phosphate transport system substrate-binding protein